MKVTFKENTFTSILLIFHVIYNAMHANKNDTQVYYSLSIHTVLNTRETGDLNYVKPIVTKFDPLPTLYPLANTKVNPLFVLCNF